MHCFEDRRGEQSGGDLMYDTPSTRTTTELESCCVFLDLMIPFRKHFHDTWSVCSG